MKAVINPRTGVWKKLTEERYKKDKKYLEADGFRLMNDKEVQKHLKATPAKKEVKQDIKPIINTEKK